jgi:4-hydroxybenzoyl-CoA thioesterase
MPSVSSATEAPEFVISRTIQFHHCDPAGIVFYPQYLVMVNEVLQSWFEDGLGVNYAELFLSRRIGIPTVRLECDFVAPSRVGDAVELAVRLHEVRNRSFELRFTCRDRDGGGDRVRIRAVLVCTSMDDHRAIPIPADIRAGMAHWTAA